MARRARKVFLSYTSELARYPDPATSWVSRARNAIRRAGDVAVDMSLFTASGDPPARLCVDRIRECGVYVAIVGFRYGSPVRDDDIRSYVELEFDTAITFALTRLVFVVSEDAREAREFFTDPAHGERQDAFRTRLDLESLTRRAVSTPDELELALFDALTRLTLAPPDEEVPAQTTDRRILPSIEPPLGLLTARLRGRSTLPEDLASGDSTSRVTVVHGVGGVGKTRLAVEVADRARNAGTTVWWVQANDAGSFETGMRAVGHAAGAGSEDFQNANPADAVWRALDRVTEPWLLIVDNADDPTVLAQQGPLTDGRGWIRSPRRRGRIMITSRDGQPSTWAGWIDRYLLSPLTPDAAGQVLLDLAPGAGTDDQASRLGRLLSGIPLLLQLAGSTIAQTDGLPRGWRGPGTLQGFGDYEAALTTHGPDGGDSYRQRQDDELDPLFERTWEISLGQLEKTGRLHARSLLLLVCCFGDAPLPYESVLDPVDLAGTDAFRGITPLELVQTLRSLEDLSLVTVSSPDNRAGFPEPATLTVHPIIRAAARTHPEVVTSNSSYWVLAAQLLLDAAERIEDGPDGVQDWTRLGPHAAETLRRPTDEVDDANRTVSLWRRESVLGAGADQLAEYGLHRPALALYDIVIVLSAGDPATASRYRRSRARMLREIGSHTEAMIELDALLEAGLVAGDPGFDRESTRRERARLLREMGRHAEALAEYDAVLDAERAEFGDSHVDVLATRESRARLLREMGRHTESLTEYDAVLDAERRRYGDRHADVLNTRFERARLLQAMGRSTHALTEYDALLPIWRERHGDQYGQVLVIRQQQARALRDLGRHADALAGFDALLSIWRERHGDDHSYLPITRHDRALVLQEMGRHADALADYDAVLAADRMMYHAHHSYPLITRALRADLLRRMGRYADSLAEQDALLDVWCEMYDDRHLYVLVVRHNRARLLHNMGRHREALIEYDAVLDAELRVFGDNHINVHGLRSNRADLLRDMTRHSEALTEFDDVLALLREQHDEDHTRLVAARHRRARVLADIGRYAEALSEFDDVLAAEQRQHGENHAYVLEVQHHRAILLGEMSRTGEAVAELRSVLDRRRALMGDDAPATCETSAALDQLVGRDGTAAV